MCIAPTGPIKILRQIGYRQTHGCGHWVTGRLTCRAENLFNRHPSEGACEEIADLRWGDEQSFYDHTKLAAVSEVPVMPTMVMAMSAVPSPLVSTYSTLLAT